MSRKSLAVTLALAFSGLLYPAAALHSSAQSNCQTFNETGKTVCGNFLLYWSGHGGVQQQGFPISDTLSETSDTDGKTYTVQYFERAVFEAHTENQPPNDVLLSLLGTFAYNAKYPGGAPGQAPDTSAGSHLFSETGKELGGVFLAYWNTHGGLAQQGYPISDVFTEVSPLNGNTYTVQYFERAVFELHPENADPYRVLLSQLGTFRYTAKHVAGQTTPLPVATPVALSAEYIIATLKAANLPIAETVVYNEQTDPNGLLGRPGQYVAKGTWHDSRLPAPSDPTKPEVSDGGGVEIFADAASAQLRYDYIQRIGKGVPFLQEYDHIHGAILLRASHHLTPAQFEEYKNALSVIPVSP